MIVPVIVAIAILRVEVITGWECRRQYSQAEKLRLWVEPGDGPLVEVAYRSGFMIRYPRGMAEAKRDDMIESALQLWLRKQLRQDVADLVRRHGELDALVPKAVRIKYQKHLWGSCGQDRVVNLNWHLIFAPRTVLEYVVVHEICHLRHRTHNRRFWGLVATLLSDWEPRKDWLDRNEHFLTLNRVQPEG